MWAVWLKSLTWLVWSKLDSYVVLFWSKLDLYAVLFWFAIVLIYASFWFDKSHRAEWERVVKWVGRLNFRVGIEEQGTRDFDLTIQIEPRWYFNFQLSLWVVYIGVAWSRDIETFPDCDHEGTECITCGCKNNCGEDNNEV